MANLDFISYPMGKYIQNNIDFVQGMDNPPKIFATNYFLRDPQGMFCTHKLAKKVWLHWAEQRIHGEVEALETPTGLIPKYEDLRDLFRQIFDEDYTREGYEYQFTFRCDAWLSKLERSTNYFRENVPDMPEHVFEVWDKAKAKIEAAREKYGALIKPGDYAG
jgi:phosphoenolpyruvate carboxykinase (GTP)